MNWPHKDLLDVSQLSREDVEVVMRTAASFRESWDTSKIGRAHV